MLLNEAVICASPVDSTSTLRFFELAFAIVIVYLVTFFLLATVFLFPFRVRELFFVR